MAARNYSKLCGGKLSKSEKRMLRKQRFKMNSLQRNNAELELSSEPTAHLLVGNGGLMNGVDRNFVVNVFKAFGVVERVVMMPQRSYSFVTYTNVEDAKKAMTEINGVKLDSMAKSELTLYLSYLKCVPDESLVITQHRPPGLVLVDNFITEEEEKCLLERFSFEEDKDFKENDVNKKLKHRQVQHFGYEFLYGTNNIDVSKPLPRGIPGECHGLLHRMVSSGYIKEIPDQLTVNQYQPGQGIPPHVDTHSAFEDGIVSLSLGSKVSMEFRNPDGRHVSIVLPQRSLLVMTGESRYQWSHGITPRKFDIFKDIPQCETNFRDVNEGDSKLLSSGITQYERQTRTSLTFRKIKQTPCKCSYAKQCDSQNQNSTEYALPKTQQDAEKLETTHVHEVYEKIADHFSDTRHSPWPKIASFLRSVPKGSLVADVGCGNGKYLGINDEIYKMGSDRSVNLASIAKERGHSVIVCDVLSLPFRSGAFDVSMCIAVLHHLSTEQRRLAGLRELVRIVRPGGLVLVYVWALEQNLEKIKKKELKELDCSAESSSIDGNKTDLSSNSFNAGNTDQESHNVQVNTKREVFEQQDLFVPWKFREKQEKDNSSSTIKPTANSSNVYHRFYHVFKQGELVDLCNSLDNVSVKELYYDRGNWCVILEKIDENNQ